MQTTRRMTQEDITRAFENRWRIKGFDQYEVRQLSGEDVKRYCRDFFETGILIAEGSVCCDTVATTTSSPTDFDHWWNLYDKKVGREKAQKLWAKLSNRDKMACLEYTPLYVSATSEKRFRKNPETFLRNKSWNDEIIVRNDSAQQRLSKLADILKS